MEERFRAPAIIRVTSSKELPMSPDKRKYGALNNGVYCKNEECRQFIALSITPEKAEHYLVIESDPPGGDIWIRCGMCGDVHRHHQSTFREIRLTDRNKQRPHSH